MRRLPRRPVACAAALLAATAVAGCGSSGVATSSAVHPANTSPGSIPATTGPATTGPATTGPATTGPATTGPATTGPATTGPATTGPATTGSATTGSATTGPATTGPATASMTLAATAIKSQVMVYAQAGGPVTQTFGNPQPTGAPLTFLVKQQAEAWLEVYLPVRPNGATGWVHRSDVETATVPYSVEVSTTAHQLQLYKNGQLILTYPAATGTGGTPSPHGLFYLTELLAPTNPGYGPYAYGLSAFSTVLTSFGGGPGQIGLHGTNESNSIGHSTSHGCIRLSNTDITTLAKLLPLGTPVHIT